jgi:hypothetical protein
VHAQGGKSECDLNLFGRFITLREEETKILMREAEIQAREDANAADLSFFYTEALSRR